MASKSAETAGRWGEFLRSPALSLAPPETTSIAGDAGPSEDASRRRCPRDYYWRRELLEKWAGVYPGSGDDAVGRGTSGDGVATISYGAHLLLASFLAESLRRRLSLVIPDQGACLDGQGADAADSGSLRVGIAIPEGPFLPLFILAVHSLNVAVGEGWLALDNRSGATIHAPELDNQSEATNNAPERCGGVVLIPLEADEAPERLRHILGDALPDLVLVAPGRDWGSMENALKGLAEGSEDAPSKSMEVVDFTQLTREAISSLRGHMNMQRSESSLFVERLWPFEERSHSMDSLRYPHSIPGCFDVARLVAVGMVRLADGPSSATNAPPKSQSSTSQREIVSHIVYTSGTTGKPKGCVSSLGSLQHYIRAKNAAHSIGSGSRILLASAVTFDPCLSDVLATCAANATLCIAPRERLYGHGGDSGGLTKLLRQLEVSHVLCTPTLWGTVEGNPPDNVPSLRVAALGGEPIPKAMVGKWARTRVIAGHDEYNRQYPRLCATYGVTEACVYQTFGEVVLGRDERSRLGQSVGLPLQGTNVHICRPCPESEGKGSDEATTLEPVKHDAEATEPSIGEVVLSGAQVDAMSSYLNLPELTSRVFVQSGGLGEDSYSYCYRTGDLGYINDATGNLHLLGRIKGDGMIKINGIRLELSEVENAVIDDDVLVTSEEGSLVVDCMAAVSANSSTSSHDDEQPIKKLVAYCLLSAASTSQLGISPQQLQNGLIVPPGPLLSLLRARCDRRVRRGCVPSFFVLIDRLPLSPTGKRDRTALRPLAECSVMGSSNNVGDESSSGTTSLWNYGTFGPAVANKICEILNLNPCQRQLVAQDATFAALGGDSLAATRVVRGLYAQYHGVVDSRNLGGSTGTLDGPFAAKYLLSKALGEYVKCLESKLDSQSAFGSKEDCMVASNFNQDESEKLGDPLYERLLEAITLGHTAIASSLLDLGVDPNSQPSGKLGKVKDRKQQRATFKSNPLHLAAVRGNPYLVHQLLTKGCKANCPDASGSFPIHLACSKLESDNDTPEEDLRRRDCVKLLLDYGRTPISIKDGNKQTILHSAARSGHCELLKYIMSQWKIAAEATGLKFKSHGNVPGRIYDWYDRWFRTPVHWAVLNGRTSALRILLDCGCSAFPPKPKSGVSKRSTGVVIETPLEMCHRLYGSSDVGREMSALLENAKY